MKIAVFTTYNNSLLTWSQTGTLERELKIFDFLNEKYNLKVIFVTYGDKKDFKVLENYKKFEVFPIYSKYKKFDNKFLGFIQSFFILFLLKKELKNINIVYQNQLLGSWVSILFSFIIKKPIYIRTGYDMYKFSIKEKKSFIKIIFYKLIRFFSLKFCSLYSVSNESDLKELSLKYKQHKNKLVLRPNWAEYTSKVPFENRSSNKFLTVGRLVEQKNFELLLYELQKFVDYVELDVVGEGPELNKLLNLSKELKVKVNFLGKMNNKDLLQIYQNYKFFFSSAKFEGNPKTVLEAMGSGCVVFASDIPSHRELINHSFNGYIYDLNNPNLYSLWKNELNNEEYLKRVSLLAQLEIKEKYNFKVIAEKYYEDFKFLES